VLDILVPVTLLLLWDRDSAGISLYFQNKSSVTKAKDSIIMAAISKLKLFPPPIIKFEWPKYEININPNEEEYNKKHKGNAIKENLEHCNSATSEDEKQTQDKMRNFKKRAVEQLQRTSARNIRAVMGERELQGKHRFVAEGFANDSECSKLMNLAQVTLVLYSCISFLSYVLYS
jgi:hypothetical protein